MERDPLEMTKCPYCAEAIRPDAIRCRWCRSDLARDPQPASGPAGLAERGPWLLARENAAWLVLAGSALVAIAPLTPWVHVVLLGSLNLFDLASEGGGAQVWAWLPLVIGAVGIYAATRHKGTLAVVLALVAALVNLLLYFSLVNGISDSLGLAQIRLGPFLGLVGALLMFINGLRLPSKQT